MVCRSCKNGGASSSPRLIYADLAKGFAQSNRRLRPMEISRASLAVPVQGLRCSKSLSPRRSVCLCPRSDLFSPVGLCEPLRHRWIRVASSNIYPDAHIRPNSHTGAVAASVRFQNAPFPFARKDAAASACVPRSSVDRGRQRFPCANAIQRSFADPVFG